MEDLKLKSFNEIFFDVDWDLKGVKNWRLNQNRYVIEEGVLYKSQLIFNFFIFFV